MKESKFEQIWSKKAESRGWYSIKLGITNRNGIPDRMFLKDGNVFFVEFKSKKGILSPLQRYVIAKIRKLGFHVLIIREK